MNASTAESPPTVTETYRVEELAAVAGVGVDTIRYYQKIGLLPPPVRRGRVGEYQTAHRERLDDIRRLTGEGFSLDQVGRLLDADGGDPLLADLVRRRTGGARLDRDELAAAAGLDRALVDLAADLGLIRPLPDSGIGIEAEHFSADVVSTLATARELVDAGLPVDELVGLAARHAAHVEATANEAVAVFGRHVGHSDLAPARVGDLIDAVGRMVGEHFARALVERAADLVTGEETAQ